MRLKDTPKDIQSMKLFDEKNLIQQLSIDSVIFGYKNKELKVLVPQLNFKNPLFSLPGGFIFQDESIDLAAKRNTKVYDH